jgi:4-coumarate--CoA ligase
VAPSELEDMLVQHPDVIDAAVCATYDDNQATEIPIAYVSLSETTLGLPEHQKRSVLEAINTWIDGKVAGYKKIRGGVFHLQQLPKTPSGKLLRRELPIMIKKDRASLL